MKGNSNVWRVRSLLSRGSNFETRFTELPPIALLVSTPHGPMGPYVGSNVVHTNPPSSLLAIHGHYFPDLLLNARQKQMDNFHNQGLRRIDPYCNVHNRWLFEHCPISILANVPLLCTLLIKVPIISSLSNPNILYPNVCLSLTLVHLYLSLFMSVCLCCPFDPWNAPKAGG